MKKLLSVLLILFAMPAFADAKQDAAAAYARGDYAAELRVTWPLATKGLAWAQNAVGWSYSSGRGVAQDDVEAMKWFRLAAAQGYANAQFGLGRSYGNGLGVAKNEAEAAKWYRLAANQGNVSAQAALGAMYDLGGGLEHNEAEAVKWYRLAAAQGHKRAELRLGVAYWMGLGVTKNYDEAANWFRLAAAQGVELAQTNLELVLAEQKDATTCQELGFAVGSSAYGQCQVDLWYARHTASRQQAEYEQRSREYEAQVASAQADARREDYLRKARCGFATSAAANQRGATNGQALLNILACEAGASGPVSVPPPPPPRSSGPLIINTPRGTTTCYVTRNVINCNR